MCSMDRRLSFVLLLLAIVLCALIFNASDYTFGIFKLFLIFHFTILYYVYLLFDFFNKPVQYIVLKSILTRQQADSI